MVTKKELQDGPFVVKKISKGSLNKNNMSPLKHVNLSGLSDSKRVKMKKLDKLVNINRETINPQKGINYDVIDLGNIDKSIGEISKTKKLLGSEISSRKAKFEDGDIIFGKLRPYLNQVAIINKHPEHHNYFIGSSEWIRLTPIRKDITYFIFLALRTKFTLYQTSASHGSVRPRFNPLKSPIFLPILRDDNLLITINNIISKIFNLRKLEKEKLTQLISKYDELANIKTSSDTLISNVSLQKINIERMDHNYYMLLDMWKEIESKNYKLLNELVVFSSSKIDEKYNPGDTIKYITISDVNPDQGEITSWEEKVYKPKKQVANKAPNRAQMLLDKYNILLPFLKLSNDSIAWVPEELRNCISTNGFAILENPNIYGFIYIALRSETVQSQLKLLAAGTIMEDITPQEIGKIRFFLPKQETLEKLNSQASNILNNLWTLRKCYNEVITYFEEFSSNFINKDDFLQELEVIKNEIKAIKS